MIINVPFLVEHMESFLRANYEQGAHWLYETWDKADYEAFILDNVFNTLPELEVLLRARWELILEQERNCAWGAPDEPPC